MRIGKKEVRVSLAIVLVLWIAALLWLARGALYPFGLALFLAYLLNPLIANLEQKRASRAGALVFVYIALLGALAVIGVKLVPLLVRELEAFAAELPAMADRTAALVAAAQDRYDSLALPYSMRLAIDEGIVRLENTLQGTAAAIVQAIFASFSYAIGVVISPVLAFYLLYDWPELKQRALFLIPGRRRADCLAMARDINKVLHGVIRGQILIAAAVGVIVAVSLYLLDIRYALLIGILAGLLDIIPYFGAIIGAAPAVAMALLYSPAMALKVAALFLLIHQVEGSVIQPKILGDSVGLHPLTVVFCVLVGGELWGLPGMLAAVPAAAVGKVVAQHIFRMLM